MADTSAVFFLTLFFNFLFFCATKKREVSCAVGSDCVLPCSFETGPYIFIHWRRIPGKGIVHSYYDNQNQLQHQHEDYSGRTFLFETIHEGDASLLIKEVRVQDKGRYMCITSSDSSIAIINLKVFVSDIEVDLRRQGSELICRSEGIYPEPGLMWGIGSWHSMWLRQFIETNQGPLTYSQGITVLRSEDQLYDVHSSVIYLPHAEYTECFVYTAHGFKSAVFKEKDLGVFLNDAVLRCPKPDLPIKSLTWKFNNDTIYRRTGSEQVFNESWRPFLDALTESSSLVLKDLTPDQAGHFSCHIRTDKETIVTGINLMIQFQNELLKLKEEYQNEKLRFFVLCVIYGSFFLGYAVRHFKERDFDTTLRDFFSSLSWSQLVEKLKSQ